MNKKTGALGLFFLVLLLPLLLSAEYPVSGQGSSSVSGVITSSTTWTKTSSPYNLAGPTRIDNGVTLTIEPGVIVNLNGYTIEVNGTLIAVGTRTDPIQFTWGSGSNGGGINFSKFSTAWNEQTASGCIVQNAVISSSVLYMGGSPKIFNNTMHGGQGVSSTIKVEGGSPLILNNVIEGGYESSNTIIIQGGSPEISGNRITGYVDNGLWFWGGTEHMARFGASTAVVIEDGNVQLTGNSIEYGYHGISLNAGQAVVERNLLGTFVTNAITTGNTAVATIRNNTFTKDSGGISGVTPLSTINYNNIGNTWQFNLQINQNGAIDATNNWWGTTNTSAIQEKIEGGTVNFAPFLTSSNLQAMPESNATKIVLPTPPKATATTISVSSTTPALGTAITISGTVTAEAKGPLASVSVSLVVIYAGNTRMLEPVATDASGIYRTDWTPPIEGECAITAFVGSNETYSGSSATLNIMVGSSTGTTSSPSSASSTPFSSSPLSTPSSGASQSPSQNPTNWQAQPSAQPQPQIGTYIILFVMAVVIVAVMIILVKVSRLLLPASAKNQTR